MKAKALEIRWHDTQPIFSADFHQSSPEQHRKVAHPYAKLTGTLLGEEEHRKQEKEAEQEKIWRLATAGGDKLVRLWLVRPRPTLPPKPLVLVPSTSKNPAPLSTNSVPVPNFDLIGSPSVEYLATLKQHTGVINVVRFAPCGDTLATAGDDGNILFWIPGEGSNTFGESAEDKLYEKESWRVRSMLRSRSGQEIYDIAWSPDGSKILAGSVDHTASIYDVSSGQLMHTIAEHTNYVQGVAWDPRDHFIATQSSDRSMHIYSLAPTATGLQVQAVGKNARMDVKHKQGGSWANLSSSSTSALKSLTSNSNEQEKDSKGKEKESNLAEGSISSQGRPRLQRSDSRASDSDRSEASSTRPSISNSGGPISGTADEPTLMDPPFRPTSSRNSSTSGSQTFTTTNTTAPSPTLTPHSVIPSHSGARPFRSPSPAPLPAVRLPPSPTLAPATTTVAGASSIPTTLNNVKLYGDANSTPFFRRLTWSTDGSLLLTPAGLFEDPYAGVATASTLPLASNSDPSSSKKKRKNSNPVASSSTAATSSTTPVITSGPKPTVYIYSRSNVSKAPIAHLPGHKTTSIAIRFCPVLWELRRLKKNNDENEAEGDDCPNIQLGVEGVEVKLNTEEEEEEVDNGAGVDKGKEKERERPDSLFDLPYRMIYAVATLDAVFLYDTQQAGPICMFGNLHYAPFTDLSWSADGETLVVSSQDGYCSIVAFDPKELGTPYTKPGPHQTITFNKSIVTPNIPTPAVASTSSTSTISTLPTGQTTLPFSNIPNLDLTKDASTSSTSSAVASGSKSGSNGETKREAEGTEGEPVAKKQKKRAALTFMGAVGS